jgi:site-specific recombinase XerD
MYFGFSSFAALFRDRLFNETKALRKQVDDTRDLAIINLFLGAGLLVNEIIDLKAADLDFKNKRLNIPGIKQRRIPLNDQVYESLAQWSKERINAFCSNFFLTTKGKVRPLSVRSIDKIIRKYAKRANLKGPINATILRNTFAVNLFTEEISVSEASQILGITDSKALNRYIQTPYTLCPQHQ